MDINVKGLESEVVARLSQQAAAEGLSQQEWVRQVLRRTANRLSAAELVAQRGVTEPMSEAHFEEVRAHVASRRRTAVQRLDGDQRRS